jgi:hypothetical protein
MNNKKIDMKLLARILLIILALGILATIVFGEQNVSRFIVISFLYIFVLFTAMYTSMNLANTFSNRNIVFALVLIPKLIIFILLAIFIDHRMILIDLAISMIIDRIAYKIGRTRLLIDETKDLLKKEGE